MQMQANKYRDNEIGRQEIDLERSPWFNIINYMVI